MNIQTAYFDETLSRPSDWVRLDLGDTDSENLLLSDALINATLTQWSLTSTGQAVLPAVARKRATLQLARGLIARYAQDPTSDAANGNATHYRDRLAGWEALVMRLVNEGVSASGLSTIRSTRSRLPVYSEFG